MILAATLVSVWCYCYQQQETDVVFISAVSLCRVEVYRRTQ